MKIERNNNKLNEKNIKRANKGLTWKNKRDWKDEKKFQNDFIIRIRCINENYV